MPREYLIFRGRNCKPDNRTEFFNDTELCSTHPRCCKSGPSYISC